MDFVGKTGMSDIDNPLKKVAHYRAFNIFHEVCRNICIISLVISFAATMIYIWARSLPGRGPFGKHATDSTDFIVSTEIEHPREYLALSSDFAAKFHVLTSSDLSVYKCDSVWNARFHLPTNAELSGKQYINDIYKLQGGYVGCTLSIPANELHDIITVTGYVDVDGMYAKSSGIGININKNIGETFQIGSCKIKSLPISVYIYPKSGLNSGDNITLFCSQEFIILPWVTVFLFGIFWLLCLYILRL